MKSNKGILHAYSIDESGSGKAIPEESISAEVKSARLTWVHLDVNQPETKTWLESEATSLDDIVIEALLADETRPRIFQYGQGVMLILRGVNLNENADAEDMVSTRLWIESGRIISVRRRRLKAVTDIVDMLDNGKGPDSAGEFIAELCQRLFERMEPVFAELDDRLDEVEEQVMEKPEPAFRQAITEIRKKAILFRRYIAPQKEVVTILRSSELEWLDQHQRRRLQESLDRVVRYIEDIDTIRERAQIIKDELANSLSDQMNKNLYLISVIAAIFMPLGFLTGLLGINVGGIPGVENPAAFFIFCVILVVVVVFQIILFKRFKLF